MLCLGITCFHKEKEHVRGRDRLYVLISSTGVFLATFILINLALYLSFTRVGFDRVEGLQGRYFLPLLPLLGIILHTAMPRLFLKFPDKFMDVYPSKTTFRILVSPFLARNPRNFITVSRYADKISQVSTTKIICFAAGSISIFLNYGKIIKPKKPKSNFWWV